MAGKRADWNNNITKIFLDLCIAEKEKLNYVGNSRLTKQGWQNVCQNFRQQTGYNYDKKQLQNKFASLRRLYKIWKKLKAASGAGWDSRTGTITMNDEWWADQIAKDDDVAMFRTKPLPFPDEMDILFGSMDTQDGDILCIGGTGHRTPSNRSGENTPLSDDNIGRSGVGLAAHRSGKEQVVDSPPAKKTKSNVQKISESMLERSRNESSSKSQEQEEISHLLRVVREDGVNQSSELYFIATDLFRTASRRTAFRSFESPEDRIAWLRWTWENVKKK